MSATPWTLGWVSGGSRDPSASIRSFIDNTRKHGHAVSVVVSVDAETVHPSVDLGLNRIKDELPDVRVVAWGQKRLFAEQLSRLAGLGSAHTLELALCNHPELHTSGAARNYLLLSGAGGNLCSTDDDVYADTRQPSDATDSLVFSDQHLPGSVHHCSSFQEIEHLLQPVEIDILSEHERYLSLSPESTTEAATSVTLSIPGHFGDCGFETNRPILTATETLTRGHSQEWYEDRRLSRIITRVPTHPTVTSGVFLMTAHVALDARVLQPPFLPVCRTSDALFALMNRLIDPGSRSAFPPWALRHTPAEQRTFETQNFTFVAPRLGEMASAILATGSYSGTGRAERLLQLGQRLATAASGTINQLEDTIHGTWIHLMQPALERLLSARDEHAGRMNRRWTADMTASIDSLSRHIREPRIIFHSPQCPLSRKEVKLALTHYAELLFAWPEIWSRATEIGTEQK